MSGAWPGGPRVAGAAALAVERVNADKTLLPGRVLEYSWADSGCSAKQGLAAMGKLLQDDNRISAVIGPACSSACKVTSYLSGGQQVPQISWGCTSAALSNKAEYGLFSRTVSPAPSKGPMLISFMRHYKWTNVVMLTSFEEIWLDSRRKLNNQLREANMSVVMPTAFEPNNFQMEMLEEIRRQPIRIVVFLAFDQDAKTAAELADRIGKILNKPWPFHY